MELGVFNINKPAIKPEELNDLSGLEAIEKIKDHMVNLLTHGSELLPEKDSKLKNQLDSLNEELENAEVLPAGIEN